MSEENLQARCPPCSSRDNSANRRLGFRSADGGCPAAGGRGPGGSADDRRQLTRRHPGTAGPGQRRAGRRPLGKGFHLRGLRRGGCARHACARGLAGVSEELRRL